MNAILIQAALLLLPMPREAGSETPGDDDLARFAHPIHCWLHCGNYNPAESWQKVADAIKNTPQRQFGRNWADWRDAEDYAIRAGYAWHCLQMAHGADGVIRSQWLKELRECLGNDAFRAGLMPPFSHVEVRE